MKNQFRSKAFLTIKHNIQSSIHPSHLDGCKRMMENAEPILTKDEMIVLKEYLQTAWDLINPFHPTTNELISMYENTKRA